MKGFMRTPWFHLLLLIITFIATSLAGAEWMTTGTFLARHIQAFIAYQFMGVSSEEIEAYMQISQQLGWSDFLNGMKYAASLIGILFIHEMGHYLFARYYRLEVSMPYFIPFWFFGIGPSIGTMGAFIKIKSEFETRRQFFDVGVAGPLAGFVVLIFVVVYGFTHLPPAEHIFSVHPEYEEYGLNYAQYVYKDLPEGSSIKLGSNLLFEFCKAYLVEDVTTIPNAREMMHYPLLFSSFLACFFTALNLLPIGQLDGGHLLYGLLGPKGHSVFSPIFLCLLLIAGGTGVFNLTDLYNNFVSEAIWLAVYIIFLNFVLSKAIPNRRWLQVAVLSIVFIQLAMMEVFPSAKGFTGWLVFGAVVGRFLGVQHPRAIQDTPLDNSRKAVAILTIIVFVITFSPAPFIVE